MPTEDKPPFIELSTEEIIQELIKRSAGINEDWNSVLQRSLEVLPAEELAYKPSDHS